MICSYDFHRIARPAIDSRPPPLKVLDAFPSTDETVPSSTDHDISEDTPYLRKGYGETPLRRQEASIYDLDGQGVLVRNGRAPGNLDSPRESDLQRLYGDYTVQAKSRSKSTHRCAKKYYNPKAEDYELLPPVVVVRLEKSCRRRGIAR